MFPHYIKKHNRINRGSLYKGFCKLSPHEYKIKFNTMLGAGLRDVPNFIGTFLFSIKNWDLKNTCEMLSDVLKNKSSGFYGWSMLFSGIWSYRI